MAGERIMESLRDKIIKSKKEATELDVMQKLEAAQKDFASLEMFHAREYEDFSFHIRALQNLLMTRTVVIANRQEQEKQDSNRCCDDPDITEIETMAGITRFCGTCGKEHE